MIPTKSLCKTVMIFSMVAVLLVSSVSFGADWPVYRGPNHNGISEETTWKADWGAAGPKVLWRSSVGIGFSSITVADGKVLWKHRFMNRNKVTAADPIVSGNEVFASSGYNRGCIKIKVNGGNTEQIWDNQRMRNHMNCTMLWNGHVYGFDESALKCLDFSDSSEKWSDKSMGKGSLMMSVDGRMIIMSDKGELVIAKADPGGFQAQARAHILPRGRCWTVPVLANGRIYARNAKGDVVCVDVQ